MTQAGQNQKRVKEEAVNLAIAAHASGDVISAKCHYQQALELDPNDAEVIGWLGTVEAQLGNLEDARRLLNKSLEINNDNFRFRVNYGNVLQELGRYNDAIRVYEECRQFFSDEYLITNLAVCLKLTGNPRAAILMADRALAKNPNYTKALDVKGSALALCGDHKNALACLTRAVFLDSGSAAAWSSLGLVQYETRNFSAALQSFRNSLYIDNNNVETRLMIGNTLSSMGISKSALEAYDECIRFAPNNCDAWANRGRILSQMGKHTTSSESYLRAESISPHSNFYLGRALLERMQAGIWRDFSSLKRKVDLGVKNGQFVAEPFGYQAVSDAEGLLGKAATTFFSKNYGTIKKLELNRTSCPPRRIKLAYLCGEFRDHATTHLMSGIWRHHNRDKFEIIGFDNGWDDGSDYRRQVEGYFRLVPISGISDEEVCSLVVSSGVDILVNLNGYFGNGRLGVFARKPAPVTINYLGFPGTIGSNRIDYLIADRVVIPEASKRFYSEKIIYLPQCYQANDRRVISQKKMSRQEFGLPIDQFIFCCFNNTYKITPPVFQAWMDILLAVEQSSLWLIEDNPEASRNLRNEAKNHGVDPARIVFSGRLKLDEHLKRHSLADLFLDTLPYNAHTTASDALWASLPLLTIKGDTFPGRVASSLLLSLNLSELITQTISEYKHRAIFFANNRSELKKIKQKLMGQIDQSTLFNPLSLTRNLELAYEIVYKRQREGLPPTHLSINNDPMSE